MYLFWLRVALVLYGLGSLAVLPAVLYDRPRWRSIAVPAVMGGAIFQFVSMAEMLRSAHIFLPADAHGIQTLGAWLLAVMFLAVYKIYRNLSLGVFVIPVVFLLTLVPAFGAERVSFSSPLVRSGWILLHIALLLAAYSSLLFSLITSVLYLLQERRLKSKNADGLFRRLPPLDTLDQIAYRTLLFGFPCMTAGLLFGSVIAEERFGPSYFLDPKVLLSFAMWAVYVAMLFVRRSTGLRGRRAVYVSSFAVLVVLAVLVANQFSSVHRFIAR